MRFTPLYISLRIRYIVVINRATLGPDHISIVYVSVFKAPEENYEATFRFLTRKCPVWINLICSIWEVWIVFIWNIIPKPVLPPNTLCIHHYIYVIMTTMASQITSLTVVYLIVYSGADHRKHQSSASLAFVRGIHRDKGPVTRKIFPFNDVIMIEFRQTGPFK